MHFTSIGAALRAGLFAALLSGGTLLSGAAPTAAQSLFEQFQSQEDMTSEERAARSEALRQFAAILNGSDRQRALEAMEFMIANGDEEIHNFALEYGLFSPDPYVRAAALRAVLDNKTHFRLDVTHHSGADGKEGVLLNYVGGTYFPDTKSGNFIISVGTYDPERECWPYTDRDECAFYVTGTTVTLSNLSRIVGSATLTDAGDLEGMLQLSYNGQFLYNLRITLLE